MLTHPMLDEVGQLGLSGMAQAFAELKASIKPPRSLMSTGSGCWSTARSPIAATSGLPPGCLMPDCASRPASRTSIPGPNAASIAPFHKLTNGEWIDAQRACGCKLHVAYSGENGSSGRYHCRGGQINHGGDRWISFGGMRIDRAVGAEAIERLQPLGIEAAIGAMKARRAENAEKRRQIDLAIEPARYEAARAQRQYDAVDPVNRLVAAELGAAVEGTPARRARSRGVSTAKPS